MAGPPGDDGKETMTRARTGAVAALLAMSFVGSASALEMDRGDARASVEEGLLLSAGSTGPVALGAQDSPTIDGRWPDRPFLSIGQGFSYTLSPLEGLLVAPVTQHRIGAPEAGPTELGILGQYKLGSWQLDFGARRELSDGRQGTLLEVGVKYAVRLGPDWRMAIGPGLSWNLDRSRRSPFGLELGGQRSARTDSDLGLNLSVTYSFTPRWSLTGFAGYKQTLTEGSGSPADASANDAAQASIGLSLGFTF